MSGNRRNWGIRSARTVFENPWIVVRAYDTVAPTGRPAEYGLVHMKRLALGVLPIDAEGATILVGQQRFPFGRYSWELPEGGGDHERPPLESAQRELAEECRVQAADWAPLLADIHLSNSVCDERAYAFLAWNLTPDESQPRDESEDLEVRRVPFAEAVRMAVSGEMTDVFSLVMLLKADHLARTGALPADLTRLMLKSP